MPRTQTPWQALASNVLQIVAAVPDGNDAAMVKAGAIPPLVALLTSGTPDAKEKAVGVLWRLLNLGIDQGRVRGEPDGCESIESSLDTVFSPDIPGPAHCYRARRLRVRADTIPMQLCVISNRAENLLRPEAADFILDPLISAT